MINDVNFNNKGNIKDSLKYVDDNNLDITDSSCHMNYFIHKNKHIFGELGEKFKIMQTEICLRQYCDYWKSSKSRRLEERYGEILSTHFVGKNDYMKYGFLNELIEKYIQRNKILFIVLDFIDYGLDQDNHDSYEYVPHTCVLILLPNGERYDAFYINSHGKDMLIYDEYGFKTSKNKKRSIKYDHAVELMFMNSFVKFMNKRHPVNIQYDFTESHNYFGADYQSGDNYGICFVFPYIIWYYFGKYYNKERIIYGKKGKSYTIKNNREMLLKGNLTECIQSYLIDLNNNYKVVYIKMMNCKNYNRQYYIRKLDKVIEKSKNYFVKKVLNTFIPFFSQGINNH